MLHRTIVTQTNRQIPPLLASSALGGGALKGIGVSSKAMPDDKTARARAMLTAHGFDPDRPRNSRGRGLQKWTPMAFSCTKGWLEACEYLHAHGAAVDVSTRDDYDTTPMMSACAFGHLHVAKWLYKHGMCD